MGVYIPIMDRPKSCGLCPIKHEDNFGYFCPLIMRSVDDYIYAIYSYTRHADCPLKGDAEIADTLAQNMVATAIRFANDRTK